MNASTKMKLQLTAVALAAVGTVAVLAGCTGEQENPVEKTFELKDGSTITCLVIYDEMGKVIEETIACSPIEAPTAKKDK